MTVKTRAELVTAYGDAAFDFGEVGDELVRDIVDSAQFGATAVVSRANADTYHGPILSADPITSNFGGSANTLSAVPIPIQRAMTITHVCAKSHVANFASVRLGVYADANGQPGDLVVDAGTFLTGTAFVEVDAADTSIAPGLYWGVFVANGDPTLAGFNTTDLIPLLGWNSSQAKYTWLSRSFTYDALPADESAQTYTRNTSAGPMIWIKGS